MAVVVRALGRPAGNAALPLMALDEWRSSLRNAEGRRVSGGRSDLLLHENGNPLLDAEVVVYGCMVEERSPVDHECLRVALRHHRHYNRANGRLKKLSLASRLVKNP